MARLKFGQVGGELNRIATGCVRQDDLGRLGEL